MLEVPQNTFFEGFYIWFDKEKREEYYATPLYLYSTIRKDDLDGKKMIISLEKDIATLKPSIKEEVLKHPASTYFPYTEKFGMLLLRLLNADFSSYETAYNTFFYAYGYELVKEFAPYEGLKGKYPSEIEFREELKYIFDYSLDTILEIQNAYKNCVDYIYNLNEENQELTEYKVNSKFIAYVIKHMGEIYRYSYKIDVIRDNYSDKYNEFAKQDITELIKDIDENSLAVPMTNIYTSTELSNICYVILEELTKTENNPIKKCRNCGKYFIPTVRLDEIYCDYPNENSSSCKEIGAGQTYKKNLENIPALLEYRRSYQKKIMVVSRNKEDKQLKKDFDNWKKDAQSKIKLFKQDKLSHEELYQWMVKNK